MHTIKIALLGAGTVGSGVIQALSMNADIIAGRSGAYIEIKKILVRDAKKQRPEVNGILLTDNFDEILDDEEISIVVEVMGGLSPARDYMLRSMAAGKHVVTANKDVIAQHLSELYTAANENTVDFLYEASVGGGIPIIKPLKECLTANKISEIMGVINGTTNYMLTKMTEKHISYDAVLRRAQEKGYAEANPSADVDGLDAARKAAILASLAFDTVIEFEDVSVEGISHITEDDIEYGLNLGYVIKLLAVGRNTDDGIDVRVHPVFLPKMHPLASVNGVFNAVFVRGDVIGDAMFYGRGAGALPTASAVVADIIEVVRDIVSGTTGRMKYRIGERKKLCPVEKTRSSYYLRLVVADEPGVLGEIATTFGRAKVSLKSVIQARWTEDGDAEIVAVTHVVTHAAASAAAEALRALPVVREVRSLIRVADGQEDTI
ncbi:homoserine dehydrogenase [Selenomonas noxia ATCC 43541]|uniref:homoserine dehydrogenase n=1 Tax=Selenomonas noxia TaxID=135083 RepID=UPI0001BCD0C0|nr:homoserine dehydrogenase [Selenomonas noxia]EFF65553.1 homoserine dehydrogenase [Selenomonas noxia ATCC 43541]